MHDIFDKTNIVIYIKNRILCNHILKSEGNMKTLKSRFIIILAIAAFINVASAYQIQDIDKQMFPQNVS